LAVLLLSYFAYQWLKPMDRVRGIYLIPNDAVFILESDEPIGNWQELRESELWKTVAEYPFMDELETEALYLDTLINDYSWIESLLEDNHFLMSVHMTERDDYDFLFAIDIKRASGSNALKLSFQKLAEVSGWKVTSRMHRSVEIMEIMDPSTRDRFQWCIQRNYLVCSFNNRLLEKSIEEAELPQLGRDKHFMDVSDLTSQDGLARWYVQYEKLPEWLGIYSSDWRTDPYELKSGPMYSCFSMDLDEAKWTFDGYTQIHENAPYLSALMSSGKSDMTIQDVLSNRTAYYIHLGFDDIETFLLQVEREVAKDSVAREQFERYWVRTEKLLQISIREDLLGWIDDEVVLAQLNPVNAWSRENDLVVVLEAKSREEAMKRLKKVSDQVQKRTPAKFKSFQYKQYDIHYLAIKGFFSLFFGKVFEDISQPYYVILDRHVIFSNDPKTLIGAIEDYESSRTLAGDEGFQELIGDFRSSSSAFLYVNGWDGYQLAKEKIASEYAKSFSQHKTLFQYLNHAGVQLVEEGDIFRSKLQLSYGDTSVSQSQLSTDSIQALYDHFFSFVSNQQVLNASNQIKQFVKDGWYQRYYPDSTRLEIKAETKHALFHGRYFEYHPNGEVRVKGRYKKGRKTGRWVHYDTSGEVTHKERF
jgi:antitoxin component YwqK of YwqJK toxin-antitoxin module